MPKRKHRRKPTTGPRRRPSGRSRDRRREERSPDLIDEVAEALATNEPLDLLAFASSFLTATDPRQRRLLGGPEEPQLPSREEIVATFLEVPLQETSALLTAVAVLTGDDVLRSRVRREVAARGDVLPHWLAELEHARPHERAVQVTEPLGDGENVVCGVVLPGGAELSVVVYVDHNMGTVAKDGFVVPGRLPELVELMRSESDDPDVAFTDLDPAEARARITEAIEHGATVFPPLETETWPPAGRWSSGPSACCRSAAAGTSGRSGAMRTSRPSPSASPPPRSPPGWRTPTPATCWTRCCGSAPATARVIRCAGAR